MPRNPKLFLHGNVHFVTMRTETGLPLLSNPFMIMILKGILARAQELYPVVIDTAMTMGNHLHIIIVVDCPQNVDRFIRYFKTESAHAINRLTDKRKGTVWGEGYDSPPILTISSLIDKISYIFTNPQAVNLVDTIEEYPNFSTWNVFRVGKRKLSCRRIRRWHIKPLPKHAMTKRKVSKYTATLKKNTKYRTPLTIDPQAAFNALKITDSQDIDFLEFKSRIVSKVRSLEEEFREKRKKNKKTVMGTKNLQQQCIFSKHIPKKYGRRMICICNDVQIRKAYIRRYREMVKSCKEVFRHWNSGNRTIQWPPGFFPPGMRPQASLIPSAFWD